MAGIYVHIPFCKKACHYCNFHFSTSTQNVDAFVAALLVEIKLQQNYLPGKVNTIYLGGGTPSLLNGAELKLILDHIRSTFVIATDTEITLEANPDDISAYRLDTWKSLGINRLSIGVQSFKELDLRWMNRAHNADQAFAAIHLAKEKGFDNFTIDLIYGTPTLTDADWNDNVAMAIKFGVPHLSCYALTVEPKTALRKMIDQNKMADVDVDKQARQFEQLVTWTRNAGYEQYEISNFALAGARSKHNSSYWQAEPYLGLGPSAHSFNKVSRQWNVANNALYIASLAKQIVPFEVEWLTPAQQHNEYVMTSLRTIEGLELDRIKKDFGAGALESLRVAAGQHVANGLLSNTNSHLVVTDKGKFLADGIASDLFLV